MSEPLDENLNVLQGRLLLEELAAAGVRDLCVCPGSRSALLALAASRAPDVRVWSHVDERAAAFFALGLGRAGRPAALVCTSGSAGAHFLPAVVEAFMDRVPLVILTADRPPELHGCGAPQAMDQVRLFGAYVHDFVNLPLVDPTPFTLAALRAAVSRAAAVACGLNNAPGPVHLNVPFRDPLQPEPHPLPDLPHALRHGRPHGAPWLRLAPPALHPDPAAVADLAARLRASSRGVLTCGPAASGDRFDLALEVAERAGLVLLADPLSGLRSPGEHPTLIPHYDVLLRAEAVLHSPDFAPDVILHLGASLTSKPWRLFRQRHPDAWEVLVDPWARRFDETHHAAELIVARAEHLLRALLEHLPPAPPRPSPWRAAWAAAAAATQRAVADALRDDAPPWEGPIAAAVARAVPPEGRLFVASSMPIRDLDTFVPTLPAGVEVVANRGVNGIDGLIATALGLAAGTRRPTVALLGDVAFAHDASALLLAARTAPEAALTLVVIDNDGGGIFAFLPIARTWGAAEGLFTTPPRSDIPAVAAAFGARVTVADTVADLSRAVAEAAPRPGLDLILIRVDRDANVARHRAAQQAVAAAVHDALHNLSPSAGAPHGR